MKRYKILTLVFIIGIISIINLYNAKYISSYYNNYYIKQIIFYIIGFTIILILKNKNLNILFKYSNLIYIANIILLFLVLIFGSEINGSKAWFNLKFFSFEPSELMKLSLILFLINKKDENILKLILYTFIPSLLVFLEPDTGAIIFYLISLVIILINKKIKIRYYLLISSIMVLFLFLFIYFYKTNQDILIKILGTSFFYRVERIINFKNDFQLSLAMLAIFSSPIIKNGLGNIQILIPEAPTDFILAFSVSNFGLIMFILILSIYYMLIINIINLNMSNKKTNLLKISFIVMFLIQGLINISMNIGLIPIIGITLPFISYGGSSLLLYFLFLGIILSFSREKSQDYLDNNKNKSNSQKAYLD